jgi:hypothetical protein
LRLTNDDGSQHYDIFEYLLGSEFLQDHHSKELVENHGLNDDELEFYQYHDPISLVIDCKDGHDFRAGPVLIESAKKGDFRSIKLLLERGANINCVDTRHRTFFEHLLSYQPQNNNNNNDDNDQNTEWVQELLGFIEYLQQTHFIDNIPIYLQLALKFAPFPIIQHLYNTNPTSFVELKTCFDDSALGILATNQHEYNKGVFVKFRQLVGDFWLKKLLTMRNCYQQNPLVVFLSGPTIAPSPNNAADRNAEHGNNYRNHEKSQDLLVLTQFHPSTVIECDSFGSNAVHYICQIYGDDVFLEHVIESVVSHVLMGDY